MERCAAPLEGDAPARCCGLWPYARSTWQCDGCGLSGQRSRQGLSASGRQSPLRQDWRQIFVVCHLCVFHSHGTAQRAVRRVWPLEVQHGRSFSRDGSGAFALVVNSVGGRLIELMGTSRRPFAAPYLRSRMAQIMPSRAASTTPQKGSRPHAEANSAISYNSYPE